tara:strand:+ start:2467 stop:3345 length:879 start_codon:yes stop_codon:yes gene_type:complete
MPVELIINQKKKRNVPVVYAEKIEGELKLGELGVGFENRNSSILNLIKLTDKKYKLPDFKIMYVHTGDHEHSDFVGCYYFCYGNIKKECFPDFNFLNWKNVGVFDYKETVREIRNNIDLSKYEEMKVGWLGGLNGPWHKRRLLHKLGQENSDILDIINIGGWSEKKDMPHLIPTSCKYHSYVDLAQKYTILLDIEGGGYSGRLKYLFHTGRPVIVVDRVPKEFFYPFMKPWEHYIPVKNNLSDLIEKTRWIINNYSEASEIGLNGKDFAEKYLTQDYALEHIKNLIFKFHVK